MEEQQVRYIYKGYKYRIYPTNKQKEYFEQAFGATYAGGDKIRGSGLFHERFLKV